MTERINDIPETVIHVEGQEPQKVVIVDNGEGYDPEIKGSVPNHDKVEIVYPPSRGTSSK